MIRLRRELIARVEDRRLHALARLAHRGVREPDDRERGQPGRMSTSTVTCRVCSPSIVNVCARASIAALPRCVVESDQARPRLGRDARASERRAGRRLGPVRIAESAVRRCDARVAAALPELQPGGVARDVAGGGGHRARPARARLLLGDRVEAFAVHHHQRVFGVRVDRDVLARARFAVGLETGRVLGRAQQAAAVQRVGDRARAVIAGRLRTSRGRRRTRTAGSRFHRPRRSRARPRSTLGRRLSSRRAVLRTLRVAAGASGRVRRGERCALAGRRARPTSRGRRRRPPSGRGAPAGAAPRPRSQGPNRRRGEVQRALQPRDRVAAAPPSPEPAVETVAARRRRCGDGRWCGRRERRGGRRQRFLAADADHVPRRRSHEPSTVRPWRACRRRTAASVSGPKSPSAVRCSALCRRRPRRRAAFGAFGRGRRRIRRLRDVRHRRCDAGVRAAQRGARLRPDDAVDRQPVLRLELRTASSVSGPKTPSTATPSACCSSSHLAAFAAFG